MKDILKLCIKPLLFLMIPLLGLYLPFAMQTQSIPTPDAVVNKMKSLVGEVVAWSKNTAENVQQTAEKAVDIEQKQTVYKWKDEKGVWHFSETQPEHLKLGENTAQNAKGDGKVEKFEVSNKITTVQMPKPEVKSESSQSSPSFRKVGEDKGSDQNSSAGIEGVTPFNVVSKAKEAKAALEARQKQLP